MQNACGLTCLAFHLIHVCTGQSVVMDIQPAAFLPSVTPSASVTCSMESSSDTTPYPTVLVVQLKRTVFRDRSSEGADKKTKQGSPGSRAPQGHAEDDSESPIAMVTSGAAARLLVNNSDMGQRLEIDGSIGPSQCALTLVITGPESSDAGRYSCHVSVLDPNDFRTKELTVVSANLSAIEGADASPVLLAQTEILAKQQRHLQEEELGLQEELKQAVNTIATLSARVIALEEKNDNLTALTQTLVDRVAALKSQTGGREGDGGPAGLGQATADSTADTSQALSQAQTRLDRLENVIVVGLASRIKTMETETLAEVKEKLQRIEGKLLASVLAEKTPEPAEVSLDHQTASKDFLGDLERVAKRVDLIEKITVKENSQKLNQLEKTEIPRLKTRLERMEVETVSRLTDSINALRVQQSHMQGDLEKLQTKVSGGTDEGRRAGDSGGKTLPARRPLVGPSGTSQRLTSAAIGHTSSTSQTSFVGQAQGGAPTDPRSCYVCGDNVRSQPCSMRDLMAATVQRCSPSQSFCLNDVYQEEHARNIYKRCVTESECRHLHNGDSNPNCSTFTFMSQGTFDCHFCCTSDKCNYNFKPSDHLFQG